MILKAHELGMKGIALTDHETVAGHVEWLNCERDLKKAGKIPEDFKCACGNEIYLVDSRENIERYWHYILIAKNTEGHRALRELSSIAWYNGFSSRGLMRVPTQKCELENIVKKYPNTLIATTACLGGELPHFVAELIKAENNNSENEIYMWKSKIDEFMRWNVDLFGKDFYVEVAAAASKDQIKFNKRVLSIAAAYDVKIVIGSDAHYLTEKERPVHKAYLNSKDGEREVDDFYTYSHMMDNAEAFANLEESGYDFARFIELCNNSMEIYDKIETYDIFRQPIIPRVKVKDYDKNIPIEINEAYPTLYILFTSDNIQERYWANECYNALVAKNLLNATYLTALETEARVIKTVGGKLGNCLFEYFNTFQHMINLFWEQGSIVGPGRGSAVCFLSNYLLGITQLDPLQWGLKYWRFLNEERVELPDIDIDLTPSKRGRVFEALRKERSELNVIQVCTYGTEGTRSAIAAACRGYRSEIWPDGIDVEISQYLSSLIPQERGFLWSIHDAVYGNPDKERQPIMALVNELNKYPGLLEIIESIDGLVNKRGQHASGVILYNESPFDTDAIMRSPNGDLTTQYSLHEAEELGDVKYDFLVTEICDKLTIAITLLQRDGLIEPDLSLRQVYNKYLHPDVLDLKNQKLWDALSNGEVLDVFQFSTGVGLATAKQVKPQNPTDMLNANALMRLMGEKGEERPLDRYCRLKEDMKQWYWECEDAGLTDDQIKTLEPYYLPNCGVPSSQEDMMEICMDPKIANFSLSEANATRKIVAKKKMDQIPALHEKFINACPSIKFGEYVWKTTMGPQMGYSFAKPHALAYSFVGIQTLYLATTYPDIYWNCACLITNAGGADLLNADDVDREIEDEEDTTKKKNKSVNYGKISVALGKSKKAGITVLPPDINKSDLIFKPDSERNAIIYGLKGIDRIGTNLVFEIMENRPYSSMEDFMSKVKVNKTQMISLIKAGAFDELHTDRVAAMERYLNLIADKKKRITLQNMAMLIRKDLIPPQFEFEVKVFNFNKYLKNFKEGDYYCLDAIAMRFFTENYDPDVLVDAVIDEEYSHGKIKQSTWDNTYKKAMDPVRDWMKANQQEILDALNNSLYEEVKEKYAQGDINKWDMDSLGTYCHEHELRDLNTRPYGIVNFEDLDEEPVIASEFQTKDGSTIRMYEISRICGTVIDKDKNKSTVVLLTPTMQVVNIKVWKNQYAKWDRQIARKNPDGTKTIVEKSFFARGNKLIITGIRRGDDFVPKKYKSTTYPLFEKIEEMDAQGYITKSTTERAEVEE
jgi:DNA polymerase-3 subunit alpha